MKENTAATENNLFLHTISTSTYKRQAYEIIKDAILYRRLKVGVVYSQDSICAELNISRTPVREALIELSKEGYLTFLRGRGVTILPISRKEAEDIVEMRNILELSGCRLAAERATQAQIEELRVWIMQMEHELGSSGDPTQMYKLDRGFHESIFVAAGNAWLADAAENCRDHFLRVEGQTGFDSLERSKRIIEEHIVIYEAILDRDVVRAEQAMTQHLKSSFERNLWTLDKLEY